jgi:hypothetical protein
VAQYHGYGLMVEVVGKVEMEVHMKVEDARADRLLAEWMIGLVETNVSQL